MKGSSETLLNGYDLLSLCISLHIKDNIIVALYLYLFTRPLLTLHVVSRCSQPLT